MYFIDFFKRLFTKSHVGTIIWMSINLVVICAVFGIIGQEMSDNAVGGVFFGLFTYAGSLVAALSPVGEFVLRFQNGCKKPEKFPEAEERLRPLFDEVYAKAKEKNPSLSGNVRFFIKEDDAPNAFATGRSTVCVTTGLLELSDEDIKGVLAHEFGHLAHKDTYLLQAISAGNTFVNIIMLTVKFLFDAAIFLTRLILHFSALSRMERFITWIFGGISKLVVDGAFALVMYLWTKLGIAVCMISSRSDEFEADRYSCELGYGAFLAHALGVLDGGKRRRRKNMWAAVSASHPKTSDRIDRINAWIPGQASEAAEEDPAEQSKAFAFGKSAAQSVVTAVRRHTAARDNSAYKSPVPQTEAALYSVTAAPQQLTDYSRTAVQTTSFRRPAGVSGNSFITR